MNKSTYSLLVITFALSLLADFVSCSPVQFTKDQIAPQNTGTTVITPVSCTGGTCTQHHQDTTTGPKAQANILFILDTSGSTTDIQTNLPNYLTGFVQSLSGVDYRIGLITTDTSSLVSDTVKNYPNSSNDNGALQDGRLVQMSDGTYFLTPQSSTTQISVPQIAQSASSCISSNYNAAICLSDDPRGIFAANLMVSSNNNSFFRVGTPTTFIIISDADERNSTSLSTYGFAQGAQDAPSSLVTNFQATYPSTQLQVDAMVIEPGDTTCYNQRRNRNGNPLIFGFNAPIYANLVSQTGGVLGSVCNSNFTSQIGSVPSAVPAASQVGALPLSCRPIKDQYTLHFTDLNGAPVTAIPSTPDLANKKIILSTPLPSNMKAVISYDCEV